MYVINYAMDIYYNRKDAWAGIIANAMERDFSWSVSADKYIALYREITGIYDAPPAEEKKPAKKSAFTKKIKADTEKAAEDWAEKSAASEASTPDDAKKAETIAATKAQIDAEEKVKSGARGAKKAPAKKAAEKKAPAKKSAAKKPAAKKTEKK